MNLFILLTKLSGEENTYYMKIWIDDGTIEVQIMPWKKFKER